MEHEKVSLLPDAYLADWAVGESEGDPGAAPAGRQNRPAAANEVYL